MRRTYTDAEKAEALALYETAGPTAVEERMGIPKGTVTGWATERGIRTVRNEKMAEAREAARQTFETRRVELAHALLDDVSRLREELFAPCVEKRAMTVGTGRGYTEVEIVEIELDEPSFSDKARVLTSIGIAVDKVQLLSGAATQRTGIEQVTPDEAARLRDELAERRARQAA